MADKKNLLQDMCSKIDEHTYKINNLENTTDFGQFNARVEKLETDSANLTQTVADNKTEQAAKNVEIDNKNIEQDTNLTTLNQKTGGFVTPQMYGAVGDGVTDDSNAFIQACANSRVVLVPEGTYILKDVTITTDTIIYCSPNTIFKNVFRENANAYNMITVSGVNYFELNNAQFVGSKYESATTTNLRESALDILNCSKVVLNNVSFKAIDKTITTWKDLVVERKGVALSIHDVKDIIINGITFDTNEADEIVFIAPINLEWSEMNCYISNLIYKGSFVFSLNILCGNLIAERWNVTNDIECGTSFANFLCTNVVIRDCIFNGTFHDILDFSEDALWKSNNILVENCKFNKTRNSIAGKAKNLIIKGCEFINSFIYLHNFLAKDFLPQSEIDRVFAQADNTFVDDFCCSIENNKFSFIGDILSDKGLIPILKKGYNIANLRIVNNEFDMKNSRGTCFNISPPPQNMVDRQITPMNIDISGNYIYNLPPNLDLSSTKTRSCVGFLYFENTSPLSSKDKINFIKNKVNVDNSFTTIFNYLCLNGYINTFVLKDNSCNQSINSAFFEGNIPAFYNVYIDDVEYTLGETYALAVNYRGYRENIYRPSNNSQGKLQNGVLLHGSAKVFLITNDGGFVMNSLTSPTTTDVSIASFENICFDNGVVLKALSACTIASGTSYSETPSTGDIVTIGSNKFLVVAPKPATYLTLH